MLPNRYQQPFVDLMKAAKDILGRYKKKGNPERDDQIKLLYNIIAQIEQDKLAEHHAHDILSGALILIKNSITTKEYGSYLSYLWSANHSELCDLATKALAAEPNDFTQYICLASLQSYIDKQKTPLATDNILKQIRDMVATIKKPFEPKITDLSIKLSTHQSKHEKIATLRQKYQDACAKVTGLLSWWYHLFGRNAERPKSILLLETLSEHLKTTKHTEEESDKIIDGCLRVILAGIENGYYISSPLNSKLYELINRDFGLANSSQYLETTEISLAAYNAEICEATLWKDHEIERSALEKAKKGILDLQGEIQIRKNGIHVSDNRKIDQAVNALVDAITKALANGCIVATAYELTNLITASNAMNFFQLLTMTSPQVTILALSTIYASQHLPITSLVVNLAAPLLKPALVAPINATANYVRPGLFQPSKNEISEEDRQLFLAHYHLCPFDEKSLLHKTIDWKKLSIDPATVEPVMKQRIQYTV